MERPMVERRPTASTSPPQQQQAIDYQTQYEALLDAYFAMQSQGDETVSSTSVESSPIVSRSQRMLELQSQMGHLCANHGELRRALDHFETICAWIDDHPPTAALDTQPATQETEEIENNTPVTEEAKDSELVGPEELRAVLGELYINALANIATIHSRLGDPQAAMRQLLRAKKMLRELQTTSGSDCDREKERHALEVVLTANYSTLLLAQSQSQSQLQGGAVEDAMAAAEKVLDLTGPPVPSLSRGAHQTDTMVDAGRLTAIGVLRSCRRAKGEQLTSQELFNQATQALVSKGGGHSDGDTLLLHARTHHNLGVDCYASQDVTQALTHFLSAYRLSISCCHTATMDANAVALHATIRYHIGRCLAELGIVSVALSPLDTAASSTALELFTHIHENVSSRLLPGREMRLVVVLTQASLGELAFYAGDLASAEMWFTTALHTLAEIGESLAKSERVTIQGYVESYLGSALFASGQLEDAEQAHQRDLELALDSEDLHAQLRSLRNLAVVYSATQRYVEAITLWRETLEIAMVLDSKHDLVRGYSGLGLALKELAIIDHTKSEYTELLALPENQLRSVFAKQRALAMEIGDHTHQILAQQQIVATYEWQPTPEELEQRLEECDALVKLSEHHANPQFRVVGYRALANALTVQIARLAERGQRFAEAIKVLTLKRQTILQKLRDIASTTSIPSTSSTTTTTTTTTPTATTTTRALERAHTTRVDVL